MVSQALVIEFQAAIKADYGRDVSLKEATEALNDLVSYFDLLARINHELTLKEEVI